MPIKSTIKCSNSFHFIQQQKKETERDISTDNLIK